MSFNATYWCQCRQWTSQPTTLPFSVATASSVNQGGLLEFQHASDEDALDAVKEKALKLMGVQLRIVRWRLLEECDMLRVNIMAAQSGCCLRFYAGLCLKYVSRIPCLILSRTVFSSADGLART